MIFHCYVRLQRVPKKSSLQSQGPQPISPPSHRMQCKRNGPAMLRSQGAATWFVDPQHDGSWKHMEFLYRELHEKAAYFANNNRWLFKLCWYWKLQNGNLKWPTWLDSGPALFSTRWIFGPFHVMFCIGCVTFYFWTPTPSRFISFQPCHRYGCFQK